MKNYQVKIGAVYLAKVSGNIWPVMIERKCIAGFTGWIGTNLHTTRQVRIKSGRRLRRKLADSEVSQLM